MVRVTPCPGLSGTGQGHTCVPEASRSEYQLPLCECFLWERSPDLVCRAGEMLRDVHGGWSLGLRDARPFLTYIIGGAKNCAIYQDGQTVYVWIGLWRENPKFRTVIRFTGVRLKNATV